MDFNLQTNIISRVIYYEKKEASLPKKISCVILNYNYFTIFIQLGYN